MNVAVIGTGYVGLVAAACLAETGNQVVSADVDAVKIAGLEAGNVPIYEPGLDALVQRNQTGGRLLFTTDTAQAIRSAEVVFIAVGTPPDEDGSADLKHVLAVAEAIGRELARETVVVTKSTVPVGTAAKVSASIAAHARFPFHVVSNPEFLKEGAAVDDFMKPDRVVLGAESDHARSVMAELYAPFVRTGKPIMFMDLASAEMTKYAANAMLATRISFMNELANLCEKVGADVDLVRKGIGSDSRIGPAFLFPGPGYGGSCFPKDVRALVATARASGSAMRVLESVHAVNEDQKRRLFAKLRELLGSDLTGVRIAVWGLAFKPNTDDTREAPAIVFIDQALDAGASLCLHDPAALDFGKRRFAALGDRVEFATSAYQAVEGADALCIITDWNEYRHPDFARVRAALRRPVIVDGRNLYSRDRMKALGFTYASIGRATVA